MKVAAYIRVSTEMQAQEGYSLDAQKNRLQSYCDSQGWEIYDWYIDDGVSAKNLERPAMQRILKDAESRLFDVVLVYKLDRLTRSVRDLHKLLETFEQHNVKFRSVTEVYDTTTAMGKLFITIVAALAEWERENLGERVRFGMEEVVRSGNWYGGKSPFGYQWDGTTMQIVPEEAKVLRDLRRLYMSGEGYKTIASILNSRGSLRRNNEPWHSQTVWYSLENPFYAGKLRYGKDPIWSDSNFPPIFTWEEYQEQTALMNKRRQYGTSKKHEYWFNGVLKCARCGRALVGKSRILQRKYGILKQVNYTCTNKISSKSCNMPVLDQNHVESMIMQHIKNITISREQVSAASEDMKKEASEIENEIELLKKELRTIADRRKKWQYMFVNDLITEKELRERKQEEDSHESFLNSRLEELKAQNIGMSSDTMDVVLELPAIWEQLGDAERKELSQTIFESIYIDCDVETGKGVSGKGRRLPFRITEINFN